MEVCESTMNLFLTLYSGGDRIFCNRFQASFIIQHCLEYKFHSEKYTCHSHYKESYQTPSLDTQLLFFFLSFFSHTVICPFSLLCLVTIPKCRTSCFLVFHKWTQILSTDVWWMKLRNENCLICTLKMCCIRETVIGMNTNAVAEQKNNFFFINKSFYLIQTQSLYSLLINYQSNLSYEQFYSLLGSGNSSECSFGQTWPGPKAKSNSELH